MIDQQVKSMKEKQLDTGRGKIQKIVDLLTKETIDPAKQQAHEIVENAHMEAKQIIKSANEKSEEIINEAKTRAEEHKKVVEASLSLACKQTVDHLKQTIETKFFNENLQNLITEESKKPNLIQDMILSFIRMLEEQGLDAELNIIVPKAFSAKDLNQVLGERILHRLKEGSIQVGDFDGGVQVKLVDRKITIDISDAALKEIIAQYIREDFREIIFKT